MTDLTEFLLARIAEDEAEVAEWPHDGEWGPHPDGGMWVDPLGRPKYAPRSRILAECAAKRRIVEVGASPLGVYPSSEDTLRFMAAVYTDHPDYRQEWKP